MLPIFKSEDKDLMLLQTKWASQINPVLSQPILNGSILFGVSLVTGNNVINHKLGRNLIGWILVGNNSSVSIYDKQSTNPNINQTLILNSSGTATVNILVF
jgi:hypothetical protein